MSHRYTTSGPCFPVTVLPFKDSTVVLFPLLTSNESTGPGLVFSTEPPFCTNSWSIDENSFNLRLTSLSIYLYRGIVKDLSPSWLHKGPLLHPCLLFIEVSTQSDNSIGSFLHLLPYQKSLSFVELRSVSLVFISKDPLDHETTPTSHIMFHPSPLHWSR